MLRRRILDDGGCGDKGIRYDVDEALVRCCPKHSLLWLDTGRVEISLQSVHISIPLVFVTILRINENFQCATNFVCLFKRLAQSQCASNNFSHLLMIHDGAFINDGFAERTVTVGLLESFPDAFSMKKTMIDAFVQKYLQKVWPHGVR